MAAKPLSEFLVLSSLICGVVGLLVLGGMLVTEDLPAAGTTASVALEANAAPQTVSGDAALASD